MFDDTMSQREADHFNAECDAEAGESYVQADDFVTAFVGPFPNADSAQRHIDDVIVARGDSSENQVITVAEYNERCNACTGCQNHNPMTVTPEDDIKLHDDLAGDPTVKCEQCQRPMTRTEVDSCDSVEDASVCGHYCKDCLDEYELNHPEDA